MYEGENQSSATMIRPTGARSRAFTFSQFPAAAVPPAFDDYAAIRSCAFLRRPRRDQSRISVKSTYAPPLAKSRGIATASQSRPKIETIATSTAPEANNTDPISTMAKPSLCQVIRKGCAGPETGENIAQRRGGARELGKHYRRELSFHGQTSPRGVSASNATLERPQYPPALQAGSRAPRPSGELGMKRAD